MAGRVREWRPLSFASNDAFPTQYLRRSDPYRAAYRWPGRVEQNERIGPLSYSAATFVEAKMSENSGSLRALRYSLNSDICDFSAELTG